MKAALVPYMVVLVAGCAAVPTPARETLAGHTPIVTRIEQYGFSAASRFEFCGEDDCVKRTIKVMPEQPPVGARSSQPIESIK